MIDKNLLKYYEQMLLIRRFEEKSGQLYGMGLIAGFCHLYIGQEAIAVGMQAVLNKDDYIITAYRDHGHMLACGTDPKVVMAELLGKQTGCSKGKGGSMHMFDLERRFYGGHGIVGAQVSLGTGIGFAIKYRNQKGACYTYFGDGASHQGQVYESFNMASLWKLPVVYIIENNQYAMGTSLARHSCTPDLYKRGESFGIPGVLVDGMDIFEVIKAAKQVKDHIEAGKGPILLEMKTYRYRGHSMSDPANYRTKEEVNDYKDHHDPIQKLENVILSKKIATPEQLKDIDKKIREKVNEAVEFSKASSEPSEEELYTDVYFQGEVK
jgi:pyruvate dehydrogenase E1 component alpha subunit